MLPKLLPPLLFMPSSWSLLDGSSASLTSAGVLKREVSHETTDVILSASPREWVASKVRNSRAYDWRKSRMGPPHSPSQAMQPIPCNPCHTYLAPSTEVAWRTGTFTCKTWRRQITITWGSKMECKNKGIQLSLLNLSISFCRSGIEVLPSSRRNRKPIDSIKHWCNDSCFQGF